MATPAPAADKSIGDQINDLIKSVGDSLTCI